MDVVFTLVTALHYAVIPTYGYAKGMSRGFEAVNENIRFHALELSEINTIILNSANITAEAAYMEEGNECEMRCLMEVIDCHHYNSETARGACKLIRLPRGADLGRHRLGPKAVEKWSFGARRRTTSFTDINFKILERRAVILRTAPSRFCQVTLTLNYGMSSIVSRFFEDLLRRCNALSRF